MKNNLLIKKVPFFLFWSLLLFLMVLPGKGWSQTPVPMASQPGVSYTENFADIANWTNNFAAGTGAIRWGAVAVNATGTLGDGVRITTSTAAFTSGTTGGVQKGTGVIQQLSTGTSSSCAIDLYLNFTGVTAGTVSFNVATVFNSTGDRDSKLKLFYSTNGTSWTEITGTNLPYTARNNVAGSANISVNLPSAFNNISTARLRFYEYSTTTGTTPTGSQAKISVDNVTVTGTAMLTAPTVSTTAAASITNSSATLAGNVTNTGGSSILENGSVYALTSQNSNPIRLGANVTEVPTDSPGAGTGAFSGSATGLNVNANYTYNAYARNDQGTSYGTLGSFWTLANTPSAPTVGGATPVSLQVTIGGGDLNPSNTEYAIEINGSANYVQANGSSTGGAVWQTAANWGTKTVTGLTPSTLYSFRVYARNGGGVVTAFGADGQGSTLANTFPTLTLGTLPSFGNVCTNSFATGSFTLVGENLDDSDLSISSGSTELTFSESESGPYVANLPIVYSGTGVSTTIWVKFIPLASGGFNGTIAINGGGTSNYTVSASATGVSPVAQNVATDPATPVVNTTATLNGNLIALGVCLSTTEKGFVYAQTSLNSNPIVNDTSVTKMSVSGLTTGTFSLPVTGLTTATSYTYKAYVFDGVNYTYGNAVSFTTLTAADHLFFSVNPPSSGSVATNLTAFTVQALRADNSVDTEYTTAITIAKTSGPGTLTGSAATVNGAAVFSNAQFDAIGTYTISAASGSLATVNNPTTITITIPNATAVVWSGAASCASGASTTWLTAANWCGAAIPAAATLAQFGANGTASAIGFNMNGASVAQKTVGAIEMASTSAARTIQNSSTTVAGDLTLNGVVVNGTPNVIIRNNSANLLTIKRDNTSFNLGIALGNATNNIVSTDNTGGILITSIISGAAKSLTKSGVGTGALTLSGTNTYTGTTTVESGTLTLGGANALPVTASAGDIRFTAGTPVLNLGDFNLGTATTTAGSAGQLDFDVNTTVNLGTGSRNYYFKASNGQTWNATAVTINNWVGTAGVSAGASNPRIFVGAANTALTSQQLAKIHFTGYLTGAKLLGTGELVPVTSPPTITSIPASGCAGSSIVINGTNLSNATAVTIGGTPATITANTAVSVTVTVGIGTTGTIAVTTEGGTAVSVDTFAVNPGVTYYSDEVDGDGYGNPAVSQISCTGAPTGYVANNTDCDPLTSNYRLGNFYVDADNDGYYNGNPESTSLCYGATAPAGYTASITGTDCNDANSEINPNHVEVMDNGVDDNCDGNIDEVAPTSSLQASQCGVTLINIAQAIYASQVPGAEGYRFEVTNGLNTRTYDSAISSFNLQSLNGGATYATTYTIRVAIKTSGFWRAYSTSCQITTPAVPETTNVIPAQCGITLSNIATTIYAGQVTAASQYRFEVSDGVGAPRTFDSAVNRFSLTSLLGGAAYATTYSVKVALLIGGIWQDYGTACNVTTPLTPGTSNVIPSQCGITISNSWTTIYATQVAAATGYRFIVADGTSTRFFDTPNARFNLHNLAGAAPAPNTTYSISVSILYNSVYLTAGPVCTVTTAGSITRQAANAVTAFDVKAYPNPFANSFRLDLNTSSEEQVEVKVYDMLGRQMDASQLNVSDAMEKEVGSQFPSGVYNIVVTQGDQVKTLRVIKR